MAVAELTAASALRSEVAERSDQLDDEQAISPSWPPSRGSHHQRYPSVQIGWSAATMLLCSPSFRHPDMFGPFPVGRGISKAEYVEPAVAVSGPQSARFRSPSDSTRLEGCRQKCVECAATSTKMDPTAAALHGGHRRDPGPVFSFFALVVRTPAAVRMNIRRSPADRCA